MQERAKILILGGAGYFGARLSQTLATRHDVTITVRSHSPVRDAWAASAKLGCVAFDSSVQDSIPATGPYDAIVNLAMPGASEAARDPAAASLGASRTLEACVAGLQQNETCRLIHFSTFHVYGSGDGRRLFSEEDPPSPIHPYGQIHLQGEALLASHPRAIVLRATNLVGCPAHRDLRDQAKLLFLDLCRQAAATGTIELHNDGQSCRDFLPFGDAIAAVELMLQAPLPSTRLFNLASGTPARLTDAVQWIQQAADRSLLVRYGSGTDSFRESFQVDTKRLRSLGWTPHAELGPEVRDLLRYFS